MHAACRCFNCCALIRKYKGIKCVNSTNLSSLVHCFIKHFNESLACFASFTYSGCHHIDPSSRHGRMLYSLVPRSSSQFRDVISEYWVREARILRAAFGRPELKNRCGNHAHTRYCAHSALALQDGSTRRNPPSVTS